MAIDNKNPAKLEHGSKSTRSPLGWTIGGVFLVLLLSALFFYDGRDATKA
ncbi:hypothetical protein ABIF63_000300 [Bradyrhizobium japonicum]|uniref:Uncharacterized protein n=1 Tax=Bradyrhizobium japonicum TaxID=375 RepID=A0ABV2RHB8_BRAJP